MYSDRVKAIIIKPRRPNSLGFTLVEIIIGLVLSTLAISLVATAIFPLLTRSVEPIFQIRAAEIAHSILDDALSRRYDEASPLGGTPVCSPLTLPCTAAASLGIDAGETHRGTFDDVDDFNRFCSSDNDIEDVFGNNLSLEGFARGYTFRVCVGYDGNYNGVTNQAGELNAKLITVTVTPPMQASPVIISAYRGNY
ncbi:MAG: type IV pilus modification PilV family protein [Pseudomonadales bacterium]